MIYENLMDDEEKAFLDERNREDWKAIKHMISERCDNYSARFFACITPSVLFPMTTGFSDGVGRSIFDNSRYFGYAGGVLAHTLRNRPDAIDTRCGYYTLGDMLISSSLFDGVILSGLSYGVGYAVGFVADKVNDLF